MDAGPSVVVAETGDLARECEPLRGTAARDGARVSSTSGATAERLVAGGFRAVAQLAVSLVPALRRWAHGRLPRRARRRCDTEDLLQEALLGALEHMDELRATSPNALQCYLRRSIQNRICNERRRASLGEVENLGALDFADRRASPARELEETEHRERFRRAVLRLEPRFQELLIGWLELGLSWQDLAGACGFSSADAARMAAKRAVYRVAALMGETASTPSRG